VAPHCKELVVADFSDAIFMARRNLEESDHALFFMADIKDLPFRRQAFDFLFCLGVLHHLPSNALDEVRALAPLSPELLIYLYYALDNRPVHYRILLGGVHLVRHVCARIRTPFLREVLTWFLTVVTYLPLIALGHLFELVGMGKHVPLYEGYRGKGIGRIRQDVYDRFFTRIEQRFSREEIQQLTDTFSKIEVSDNLPYWHFICRR
ncbi:MAG: class I SAM-dependent methyltransferase, partial [Magnetococcales bacterium]|nr:class I SAM-dependent methyltransferase [Magnetococcales bacterium]